MDRAFESGAAGSAPSAPGSPSIGYPTGGNPGGGTPPTKPGPYWFHMITEELRAIVAAAGLTPAQGTIDQVLQALPNALASRPEMARSLATSGYQKLPGGLIIQWGNTGSISGAGAQTSITLPIACPTGLCSVSLVANVSTDFGGTVLNFTTTTFTAVNHGGSPANFFYLAIGY